MYLMKRELTASAAIALLIGLAAPTQASPINPFHAEPNSHALSARSEGYGLQSLVWGNPGAHRHARFGAHPSLARNGHPDFGFPAALGKDPWSGFRFHPALCGKSPGAGVTPAVPEETEASLPEVGQGSPDEEDSPALIADTRGDSGPSQQGIPAVPEPGSLALMSAGLLGLMAARSLLKDRQA
jgi:PEP-CTERM motif